MCFSCRVKGDHFIYWKDGVEEIVNIQPDGNKAKAYQVKQVRSLVLRYKLCHWDGGFDTLPLLLMKKTPWGCHWDGGFDTYERIFYWSEDDGKWIVEVPELSGCMADGATPEDALHAAEVVIAEWLETARSIGRPIPVPKGRLAYA